MSNGRIVTHRASAPVSIPTAQTAVSVVGGVPGFGVTSIVYNSLGSTGRGTEFHIGGSAFCEVYADWPVELWINRSPVSIPNVRRVRLEGYIEVLEVRRQAGNTQGTVKLVFGWPNSVNYQERDPIFLPCIEDQAFDGGTWTNGSATHSSAVLTVPISLVSSECIWIKCLSVSRSAGTITRLELLTNYGAGVKLWDEFVAPNSFATFGFTFGQPIKVSAPFFMRLTGDVQGANTTVDCHLIYSAQ